jgi:hypothetical protein
MQEKGENLTFVRLKYLITNNDTNSTNTFYTFSFGNSS